jgi:hypothetical protein
MTYYFITNFSKMKSRYDWRSVSTSWCRTHFGTRDQILILSKVAVLCIWAPSLTRGRVCLLSVIVSITCPMPSLFTFSLHSSLHFMSDMFYIYIICTRPLPAQAQYNRSCPVIWTRSLLYNNAWTLVRATATKFKPLICSVSGFALS